MISHEHLQQLLDLRRSLLREVVRLDGIISQELAPPHAATDSPFRDGSWEEALHKAKIHPPGERPALAMHA